MLSCTSSWVSSLFPMYMVVVISSYGGESLAQHSLVCLLFLYCEHSSGPAWPLTTIGLATSEWNEIIYCDTKVWLLCYAIAYPPMEIKFFFKPSPLFLLYNSETWTLTYTKEKLIDAFHRGLLRISINVRYPKIIKSTKLYTLTQQTPLSAGGGGTALN